MQENHRKPPGLTPRAEKTLRRIAVAAVFVIAAAAAILSFNGLRNLALAADIPVELAWIFPIVVDGLTLVGSLGVVHAVLTGLRAWYPWFLTLLGVGLSVWGNVASSPPTLVAQIVHAIPPLVLALSLEALLKVYRYRAVAAAVEEEAATAAEHEVAHALAEHPPFPGETPAWATPERALEHRDESESARSLPAGGPASSQPDMSTPDGALKNGKTTRELLLELVAETPNISATEAARILGKDRSNVAKILREIRPSSN